MALHYNTNPVSDKPVLESSLYIEFVDYHGREKGNYENHA